MIQIKQLELSAKNKKAGNLRDRAKWMDGTCARMDCRARHAAVEHGHRWLLCEAMFPHASLLDLREAAATQAETQMAHFARHHSRVTQRLHKFHRSVSPGYIAETRKALFSSKFKIYG